MRRSAAKFQCVIILIALCMALTGLASAHSSGISGYSITGCNSCHPGAPLPTSVVISGPTTVTSGSTNTYTLTTTGGAAVVGGLDVSHDSGTFVVVDTGTKLLNNEITHNAPRNFTGTSVSWTMNWTAPTVTANTTANLHGSSVSSDGGGPGGGSLSTSLAITVTAPASSGGGGGATAPSITTQPASQSVAVGQTATFSVVAAGTAPLTYQWLKNGSNIAGATTSSYTTPATSATDNGSVFSVLVTNAAGSAASSSATLTVGVGSAPGPGMSFQMSAPASATGIIGQPITMTVAIAPQGGFNSPVTLSCSGLPANAAYSWSQNPVTPTNGAATSTLTIVVSPVAKVMPRGLRPVFALLMPMFGIVTLGSAALGRNKKKRTIWLLLMLLVLLALMAVGCGGASSSTQKASSPSGPQSFNVTINATSGSTTVSSTVPVTLN